MGDTCVLCDEQLDQYSLTAQIGTEHGMRKAHQVCMLRNVIGGIGHLIAHDYWCTERHDPDAGLTRYQSAILVREYVHVVGVEQAVTQPNTGNQVYRRPQNSM